MSQLYPNWDNVQPCIALDELVACFVGWFPHPMFPKLWISKEGVQWHGVKRWSLSERDALQIWKLMPKNHTWWSLKWDEKFQEWWALENVVGGTTSVMAHSISLPLTICIAFCKAKYAELCEKLEV